MYGNMRRMNLSESEPKFRKREGLCYEGLIRCGSREPCDQDLPPDDLPFRGSPGLIFSTFFSFFLSSTQKKIDLQQIIALLPLPLSTPVPSRLNLESVEQKHCIYLSIYCTSHCLFLVFRQLFIYIRTFTQICIYEYIFAYIMPIYIHTYTHPHIQVFAYINVCV